jgi:hypothetical protein
MPLPLTSSLLSGGTARLALGVVGIGASHGHSPVFRERDSWLYVAAFCALLVRVASECCHMQVVVRPFGLAKTKIIQGIIGRVFVDVMNGLIREQLPSKMGLHHCAMLKNAAAVLGKNPVSIWTSGSAFVARIAFTEIRLAKTLTRAVFPLGRLRFAPTENEMISANRAHLGVFLRCAGSLLNNFHAPTLAACVTVGKGVQYPHVD